MASQKLFDPFLKNVNPVTVTPVNSIGNWDGIVIVSESLEWGDLGAEVEQLRQLVVAADKLDKTVTQQPTVLFPSTGNTKWMVYSPTGPVNRDYDDVRCYREAVDNGLQRAFKAGHKRILLIVPTKSVFKRAFSVSVLAALQAAYVPLEIREDVPSRSTKVNEIGIYCKDTSAESCIHREISNAIAMESGRIVTRDIGGSDPERMAALRAVEYCNTVFKDSVVKVTSLTDAAVFRKDYPLLSAVDRCASYIDRHRGAVIDLEYTGEGEIKNTYLFVGKGITYDTGGADVKAGGVMAGMHRDKCGAATVAGLFKVLAESKPKGVRFLGKLAMVRNSIGADCYVADEIITSAAGARVRIGNTDAEGRMVMADCLYHMKDKATKEVNPHLFTIATLTGHAIRAMGPAYSIAMDNGPARGKKFAQQLQDAGHIVADPFEISTIRREDFMFVSAPSEYEDVLQANNKPSTATARGHQYPAAFLTRASGLDKHGIDSSSPLAYTHMDIAGSSGPFPGLPTGAPIPAIAAVTGIFA